MTLVTALAALLASAASDETVGLRLREWYAHIDGHVQAEGESIPSTDLDLDRDLGVDSPDLAHELQASLTLPLLGRLTAGAWFVDYEGDSTVTRTFTFAGQTFTTGTRVKSEMELDVYYLSYEFVFPSLPLGDLLEAELGIIGGGRLLRGEGSVESDLGSGEDSGVAGLPVVGIHAMVRVTPWLRGDAEVVGMTFSSGDMSARYVEAYVEATGQIGPVFAGVGYKFVRLNFSDRRSEEEFMADVDLFGVYVTAGLRF
ncbi:MAG TPA: hypothetical protein VNO22_09680 [Planctomycetota bacterium]|jgi:hypothetical protein|nr:hypothetical protein [Planctomycetota bacterium]